MDLPQLVSHIERKLGFNVVENKFGRTVVEVPHQADDEWEVKRGVSDKVVRSKYSSYDSEEKEDANDHYQMISDKMAAKQGCSIPQQICIVQTLQLGIDL